LGADKHHCGKSTVTVGVAGEFVVQRMASRIETALRNADQAVFTTLNNEAAQARKDADEAIERASKADERALALLPLPSALETRLRDYLKRAWKPNPRDLLFPNRACTRPRKRESVVQYAHSE
jgi:hypothetical protein